MAFRLGFSGGTSNRFFAPLFSELMDDPNIEIATCCPFPPTPHPPLRHLAGLQPD
eukprot:COSAG04_NODE_343_length_16235_cov_7.800570_10_plen_55_part_00